MNGIACKNEGEQLQTLINDIMYENPICNTLFGFSLSKRLLAFALQPYMYVKSKQWWVTNQVTDLNE